MEHEGATEPQDQFDELLPASSLLVAEDDPQLRRFVSRALELDGFKVVPVCDGEAALAAFRNAPDAFDLVLTDAVMPRMDGLTLVKEITAQRPEQKVVFMSGYSAKLQEMMASAPEGMTFIQKPFDPEHLTQSIRRKLREPAAGIPS
jgi:DNA-binding NtrC family response regulator